MGRDRSPDNFKLLIAYMRHKMKTYNVPPQLLDTTIFASAALGFVRNVAFETSVLHGVISPLLPVMEVHRNALNHKFKTVWNWKRATAAIIAAGTVIGTGVGVASIFSPAAAFYTGTAVVGSLATLGVSHWVRGVLGSRPFPQTPSSIAFPEYYSDRSSNGSRTIVKPLPPKGVNLPATDPTTSVADLTRRDKLDPTAKLKIVDETENREKPDQGPLHPAGVVSTFSIPVVPSNSSHSSISAICERILKRGPLGRDEVDSEFFSLFRSWVFDNLESLGLKRDSVKPVPFIEWNQHYPASVQAAHVKALAQLGSGDFRQWLVDERNEFVKIESLPKSTTDGVPKLAPRAIQAGTPHHNIATGPFCKSFSKRLAALWSVSNASGPMYTSGATSEDIGLMFQEAVRKLEGDLGIIEGDFARFDSTIHRMFLELEADVYKYLGCSEQAFSAFLSCIGTKGRDKFGNRYSVDGGRHSGDHNTSCGNTLLQALSILFCCCFFEASRTGIMPSAIDIIAKYKIALPCLGDDNLVIGCSSFVDALPLQFLLLKLGLELEPKKYIGPNAKYLATFCSSRFYPVEGGKTVLGPGIGRGIVKSGWYVNPPAGVDLNRLLRADAIGRKNDCAFIPFLNLMWEKNHSLTKDVKELYTTREMKRASLHNAHVSEHHYPCEETYHMIDLVYGLTKEHENDYAKLLSSVKTLPCIVDFAPLSRAAMIDGVADHIGDTPCVGDDAPVENTPTMEDATFMGALSSLSASSSGLDFCRVCDIHKPCHCPTVHSPDMSSDDNQDAVEMTPFLSPFDN
jgi:hypothetical protein